VRRLVGTSAGQALIELDRPLGREIHVGVTTFGADGWEEDSSSWLELHPPQPPRQELFAFLNYHLGIPPDEAKTLAAELTGPWLDEWERRGGVEEARTTRRLAVGLTSVLIVLLALAVVAIALLLWLLAT
jgi:hypothetical protein